MEFTPAFMMTGTSSFQQACKTDEWRTDKPANQQSVMSTGKQKIMLAIQHEIMLTLEA
jgi:hypothetical protein